MYSNLKTKIMIHIQNTVINNTHHIINQNRKKYIKKKNNSLNIKKSFLYRVLIFLKLKKIL